MGKSMITTEFLRRLPYFTGIPDEGLKSLALIGEARTFKAGERIFKESGELIGDIPLDNKGDGATDFMILVQGQVDITVSIASGEDVVVDTCVPGDLMAISALISPYHLTASGIARDDGKLVQLKAHPLRQLCEDVPELGYSLMLQVAKTATNRLYHTRLKLGAQS